MYNQKLAFKWKGKLKISMYWYVQKYSLYNLSKIFASI